MKVWRFYLKPDAEIGRKKYDLYALTNHKKFAKKFMKERDMDKFIVRCSKEEREEYVKFANSNLSYLLDMRPYITRTLDDENRYRTKTVDVLSTDYEFQTCDSDSILIDILGEGDWYSAPSYVIFKKKIIESLRTLEYISNYKLYASDYTNAVIDPDDDDYSAPNIWIDELGVFLRTFGDTFK